MLLRILSLNDSLPTLALAVRADLTPKHVWGLLKQPMRIGQVIHSQGRWSLVAGFPGRDVVRAIELLRSKGWRVLLPIAS